MTRGNGLSPTRAPTFRGQVSRPLGPTGYSLLAWAPAGVQEPSHLPSSSKPCYLWTGVSRGLLLKSARLVTQRSGPSKNKDLSRPAFCPCSWETSGSYLLLRLTLQSEVKLLPRVAGDQDCLVALWVLLRAMVDAQ